MELQKVNTTYIYLDDRLVAKDEASVSVYDHGFLYGDGVYQAARAYDSEPTVPPFWERKHP
jgi:branched-subunit amino acid aminotransferase/4-amino-4-deoxychorismate lyase